MSINFSLFSICVSMIVVEWLVDGYLTAKYHKQRKRIEQLEKHICNLYGMVDGVPTPDYLPELMDCNTCIDKGYCSNCEK